jgi:hypothetical protein
VRYWNILVAANSAFLSCRTIGIEINNEYCTVLSKRAGNNLLINADIFSSFDLLKKGNTGNICLLVYWKPTMDYEF